MIGITMALAGGVWRDDTGPIQIDAPPGLNDAQMWALIVGFISPLALNFIVKATWPAWVKSVVAFVFSAVVGVVTSLIAGQFTGLSILSTVLLVLVTAISSYQLFWKQVAPNMQRGAAEKRAIDAQAQVDAIVSVAKPVAEAKAAQVVGNTQEVDLHDLARRVAAVQNGG